mmetsp:Transcript_42450/g.112116  ORF Transcript_42450/g.112116 Transcript_42450/m.112116 type:complete len:228 (+) Transcript_42450:812-1495(+)
MMIQTHAAKVANQTRIWYEEEAIGQALVHGKMPQTRNAMGMEGYEPAQFESSSGAAPALTYDVPVSAGILSVSSWTRKRSTSAVVIRVLCCRAQLRETDDAVIIMSSHDGRVSSVSMPPSWCGSAESTRGDDSTSPNVLGCCTLKVALSNAGLPCLWMTSTSLRPSDTGTTSVDAAAAAAAAVEAAARALGTTWTKDGLLEVSEDLGCGDGDAEDADEGVLLSFLAR